MVFPPLVVVKPFVLLTVRLTVAVCPCVTLNVPDDPRLEIKVKLTLLAVTVKITAVEAEVDPEVPVTATLSDPATLRATEIVTVVDPLPPLTLVGLKLHVIPLTLAQLKLTVPLKFDPLLGATVIDAVRLLPATTLAGFIDEAVSEKPPIAAAQAFDRLFTSTDPNPVTRL